MGEETRQDNHGVGALIRHWHHRPPRIRLINAVAIVLAAVLSLVALVAVQRIFDTEDALEHSNEAYRACTNAADSLHEASDYLMNEARVFVATGNRAHLDNYIRELEETDRRGVAVETIRHYMGAEGVGVTSLEEALSHSNELSVRELYAMRLTVEALGIEDVPIQVAEVVLEPADAALDPSEQRLLAERMVLGDEYQTAKQQVTDAVNECSESLLVQLNGIIVDESAQMHARLAQMQVIIIALLTILVLVIFAVIFLILWPLAAYTVEIANDEPLVLSGASELRYLAHAYNVIHAANRERTFHLRNAAERDHLTGLYNRGAYEKLLSEHTTNVALLLIDVDYFKSVNDTYGHDMGDAVLQKVARILESSFRAMDFPCRMGGDEFALIMTGVTPELRDVVSNKLDHMAEVLRDTSDGLPVVTLSIGVAFSAAHPGEVDLYKAADRALYVVKERGRNGYAFFDQVAEETAHV